jgi:hypothetical protein
VLDFSDGENANIVSLFCHQLFYKLGCYREAIQHQRMNVA